MSKYYSVTTRDGLRMEFGRRCVNVSDSIHGCLTFGDEEGRIIAIIPLANISGVYRIWEDNDDE